ncbi:oxidoreductase [Serinibacter arcticus]|uniref:Oxidoreductase n=1 Tax=Serinibacter arcticus TaxID=1655435 RepID=A0A2U1ZXA5_9MICO|nr:Gfo/Idh/MocA family oxidoreductase [Serinibacter arcticus]PWD51594.1 oxidoreductase [Serinibacter arcticus]
MTADENLRWGILGPGRIAGGVARDFGNVAHGEIVAVGSRDLDRASAFAAEHAPAARSHGSYAELLEDPDVEAVYIATPHSQHAVQASAAIAAGKAVLVEKSFTATYAGAERVVNEAREAGVFAMEAMWTRFVPAVVRVRELLADGAIGEVRAVTADLGVRREFAPEDRLFSLALGGGTLLDLGVYVVSFAQMVLGHPRSVTAHGSRLPTGVDAEAGLLVDFGDGRTATLQTSFRAPTPGNARIYGSEGWIDVPPRFHHPDRLVLHRFGSDPVEEVLPPRGAGYAHEFDEVATRIRAGHTESAVMSLADTLVVQRMLQDAADQLGVALVDADGEL